jgi:hypothetical protein
VSKFLLNHLERISKALANTKNPIFNPKILLPIHFSLSARLALLAHLAFGPASPAGLPSPAGRSLPHRPIRPMCRWHLHRNMFSFLVRTFRASRVLSRLSLSSGPWLLAPSPTPCRPTPAAPPPNPTVPSHPAPPSSAPRMATSRLNSPCHQDPLLNPPLNLAVFIGIKDINAPHTGKASPHPVSVPATVLRGPECAAGPPHHGLLV